MLNSSYSGPRLDIIRRSRLILPINIKKYVDNAYKRNADAVVLDLEDSIPENEKHNARQLVSEAIPIVGRGGSDVFVRINHFNEHTESDIKASVWHGLTGIVLPKVEDAAQVQEIDQKITSLEQKRGIPENTIKISILIETVKGYYSLREIVTSSHRIDSVTLGVEDFALDAGIESSVSGQELLVPKMETVFAARIAGILPMGLMGSMINYKDLKGLEQSARHAYKCGYLGASCIHPSQVEILNKSFSPTAEEVEFSKRVINVFNEALTKGRASTSLDGKMIDYPLFYKAKRVLDRYSKIEALEEKKRIARESVNI